MVHHDEDDEFPEPPRLRRLRWLVTLLTVVLILGVLSIAATIVIRLGFLGGQRLLPITAPEFILPAGHEVEAVGRGEGFVHFLLRASDGSEWLYSFDRQSGAAAGITPIRREEVAPEDQFQPSPG